MSALFSRTTKSIILFLVMCYSLKYIGFSNSTSITLSLIPLVLGIINVLTKIAFTLAALSFIIAALSSLTPSNYENFKDFAVKKTHNVSIEQWINTINPNHEKVKKDQIPLKGGK